MTICRFFLQGACRFGTKCNNEHLDVKQLVKSDLEAALNGKQWPLSCFGPFKDKPCVPGFIADHSFEEMRWLCYESKQKKSLDQYIQNFNKEALDANNKMKSMLQLSPQVIDLICRLYDAQTDATGKINGNNPFGHGSICKNDPAGIFATPGNAAVGFNNHHVPTNNTGNMFGSLTTSPAGGIFTAGNNAFNQTSQASIFGQQIPKTNSIFSVGSSQNSLFGQPQANLSQTVQPNNGLFGQQQQTPPSVSGGLFAQQQSQPISGGGLFAPNQTQSGSIFSQSIQHQNVPNAGNIFAQAVQSHQPQNPSGFRMYQTNKQQISVFGHQNAFVQQNSNMFGSMATTTPPTNTINIFGQTNATSIPTQNMFSQNLQHTTTNMFSQQTQATTMQPTTGVFQQNSQSSQPMPQQQTSFGQQLANNSSQRLLQSPVVSSSVYSKLEDLTAEDIDAFKADTFTAGKIPNVAPPRELIS